MTSPEEGHGDLMNSHDGAETNNGGPPKRSGRGTTRWPTGLRRGHRSSRMKMPRRIRPSSIRFKVGLETRNEVEHSLAELAAMNYWQIQRAAGLR